MKILILNWRDFRDPKAGGAEVLTHEMAKRWVREGHLVTQRNCHYKGAKRDEVIDGVRIIRQGNYITTYIYSFFHTLFNQFKYDILLEEVHGIPYFAHLITRKKVVVLALEVARDHWDLIYSFPLNFLGRQLEKIYFSIYKNQLFLTISKSSKEALMGEGIREKNITIIPMGLSIDLPKKLPNKEKNPTLVFLGRISPIKGIEDALEAVRLLKNGFPKIQLWIIGDGTTEYKNRIKKLVNNFGIARNTKFFGFVAQAKKFELLAKAHILLAPSKNEGWGLIVPEAGIVGTPSVAYNVNGLRDVIKNGKTSKLIEKNNPASLAKEVSKMLKSKREYESLRKQGMEYAKSFNWVDSAKVSLDVLKSALNNHD